jgi:hypothetical protein
VVTWPGSPAGLPSQHTCTVTPASPTPFGSVTRPEMAPPGGSAPSMSRVTLPARTVTGVPAPNQSSGWWR